MPDSIQQLRPIALLLCGPSLAGKSTLARQLEAHFDAITICSDSINEERGLPFGGEGLPESVWAETLRIELERIQHAGQLQRNVIVDDTCCYRWLRDRFREACLSAGLVPLLLVFRTPLAELHARHAALSASAERPVLSLERLDDHVARFEWPTVDEEPLTVTALRAAQVIESICCWQKKVD